jgi:tetrahydromethanopterin S-methyltransferase subunit G
MAVAALISTEFFVQTCLSLLKLCYNAFILPVLLLCVMILMYLLQAVIWLASFFNIGLPEQRQKVELQLDSMAKQLGLTEIAGKPVGKELFILLGVVVTVALLYLFFHL